jgi:peroxiredoxin
MELCVASKEPATRSPALPDGKIRREVWGCQQKTHECAPMALRSRPYHRREMRLVALLCLCVTAAAAPLAFQLRDTQGAVHTQAEFAGHKAVVLFFTTTDCPIANSYVPEMNRIHDAYAARGVLFYAVQTDLTIPAADVVKYAGDFHYAYPLLLDPNQLLVRFAGASITPQVAILAPEGKVLYLGRVDDRVADFGKQRLTPMVVDLRDSLDAVLGGKPVPHVTTKSIGCAITLKSTP